MAKQESNAQFIKLYHGYGHMHDLLLYGHLFEKAPAIRKRYSDNIITNMIHLLRLFAVKPVPRAVVELQWNGQRMQNVTQDDGFIKFEWASDAPVSAGWHTVAVTHRNSQGTVTGSGELFVPHKTQLGIISDIDDTIMISHSATIIKRMQILFTRHPRSRGIFEAVQEHYQLLAQSNTTPDAPNPFFYVSSSEWNLYDYLADFFEHNGLPKGAFLLNHVKRFTELLQTGKTRHNGKLVRVMRILQAFPHQRFVLFGDNTQQDPLIYKAIAEKYPGRIHAVYIRNVRPDKSDETADLLNALQQHARVYTCLFSNSRDAIAHSRSIGLI